MKTKRNLYDELEKSTDWNISTELSDFDFDFLSE